MSRQRPLFGSCACGRNRYTIQIPPDSTGVAQVFYDNSHAHRHALSNPLPTYLRIPLTWYSSTTHSYFPDESARAIRRVYTSPSDPSSLRQFCGFCGTPLTYWSESPREESNFISLTLGSLLEDDLRDLEELGLLPEGTHELEGGGETAEVDEGVPWFESMVSGSRLGKMRRSLGARRSGRWSVEWEVVEWGGDDASGSASHDTGREIEGQRPASAGKRKLGVDDEDEHVGADATMKGAL